MRQAGLVTNCISNWVGMTGHVPTSDRARGVTGTIRVQIDAIITYGSSRVAVPIRVSVDPSIAYNTRRISGTT